MLWRRNRGTKDFAEEIQAHLHLEADELEAEGLSRREADEAERRARVTFGNASVAKERFYLKHRLEGFENLMRDVRYGLRMMARNPAATLVAVLTLACGIAASANVFT